jgi:hypothetical protein
MGSLRALHDVRASHRAPSNALAQRPPVTRTAEPSAGEVADGRVDGACVPRTPGLPRPRATPGLETSGVHGEALDHAGGLVTVSQPKITSMRPWSSLAACCATSQEAGQRITLVGLASSS